MGNWRTVNIQGTCAAEELPALRKSITVDKDYENFHCLSNSGGMIGLGNWPAEQMDVTGNLAERDYSVNAVAWQLEELMILAPSLRLKVHCGDEYESLQCIATITVGDRQVSIGDPEIERLPEISREQFEKNYESWISNQRR
jgi:hypothetical protein